MDYYRRVAGSFKFFFLDVTGVAVAVMRKSTMTLLLFSYLSSEDSILCTVMVMTSIVIYRCYVL